MKTSRLLLTVATVALVLLFTVALSAKPPGVSQDDPRILIKTVDATAGTVEFEYMTNQTTHVYKIDSGTLVKVNNVTGKITGIESGMQVRDSAERDSDTLDSISVSPADPAPVGTSRKKKNNNNSSDSQ
jgi:Ethanolamine utilization protein EutJ (predicted chaperonin)